MEIKAVKPIRYISRISSVTIILTLLALLALGVGGCARSSMGIRIIPLSNRSVLALSPDDVVEVMRRAGFSDGQILEYGTDLRNGLAESGAVQIKIGKKVEAVFAVNLSEGNCVYISTRLRGNFIYDVDAGWVGKQ
ncbi:MAG: hypothetical protein JW837_03675 [Sedimentisphaerales bacterium]|nr:hypothetical protein [Sedimentisphaerales bacterium]